MSLFWALYGIGAFVFGGVCAAIWHDRRDFITTAVLMTILWPVSVFVICILVLGKVLRDYGVIR